MILRPIQAGTHSVKTRHHSVLGGDQAFGIQWPSNLLSKRDRTYEDSTS
jgi:hypothetical protein